MSTSNQMNIPAKVLTEEEKDSIIRAAKEQYKDSIKSRRVEAVQMNGEIFSGKAPFFSGWASGAAGHWGVVVDGLLHHLVFKLDKDRKPIGIKLKREDFEQEWIDAGKVSAKEEIGSTSLPLEAIKAVGETLILQFGNYRRLYRNCQTFADIFVQIVCDVERKAFSSPSIQNVIAKTLLAFPLTTIGGMIQKYITTTLEILKRFSFKWAKTAASKVKFSKKIEIKEIVYFSGNTVPLEGSFDRNCCTLFVPNSSSYSGFSFAIWNPSKKSIIAFQVMDKLPVSSYSNNENLKLWVDLFSGDLKKKSMKEYWILPKRFKRNLDKNDVHNVIMFEEMFDDFPALSEIKI